MYSNVGCVMNDVASIHSALLFDDNLMEKSKTKRIYLKNQQTLNTQQFVPNKLLGKQKQSNTHEKKREIKIIKNCGITGIKRMNVNLVLIHK